MADSKIFKILPPNFPDFQNFQRSALMFWKILSTRSGHFGNFGYFGKSGKGGDSKISKKSALCFGKSCPLGRAILEILEISEILEMSEILDFLEVLEFLELIFRRADCDPSDDRPCTTTHIRRQGLSILMPIFKRISTYVYIYICIDTPTDTSTNTTTDIDHLLNAQANTSINIDIAHL